MYTPVISHPALKQLVEMEYLHLCLDETGTSEIEYITKNLELKLAGQLKGLRVSVSDIRKIESRFILLVGSDDNLLEAVGAYIYCLNCIKGGGTSLFYHSFCGESEDCLTKVLATEDTFRNHTSNGVSSMDGDLLDHISQGRSVFLSDLKYPKSLLLEKSGKRIRGIVTHWETCGIKKRGLLVVSAKSEEDLPEYFVRQFEIVKLEPVGFEVQDKSPIAQEIDKLFYDDAKGFLFLETGNPCKLTGDEQTLVDFLKDGKQHVDEIIDHFQNKKEFSAKNWERGDFDSLKSGLNAKIKEVLGVATLIRNQERRSGMYHIPLTLKDKKFKK